jgi:hypothetical protein
VITANHPSGCNRVCRDVVSRCGILASLGMLGATASFFQGTQVNRKNTDGFGEEREGEREY